MSAQADEIARLVREVLAGLGAGGAPAGRAGAACGCGGGCGGACGGAQAGACGCGGACGGAQAGACACGGGCGGACGGAKAGGCACGGGAGGGCGCAPALRPAVDLSTPAPAARGVPSGRAGGEPPREACVRPTPAAPAVDAPADRAALERLLPLTSSQIAVGRTGTRFKTDLYLRIREGHADAKDAVHTEVPEDWPARHGLLPLATRARDRHEYLLHPNQGRRLDARSAELLEKECPKGIDVQVIAGDGLSPLALLKNGPETLTAVTSALTAAGLSVGRPVFVRFARIGVADDIGVRLGARATVILVGERPGLGTGDSLSIYIAINPKLDQDNAEKNCISNVRPIGIRPAEAGALTARCVVTGFARGGGGVAIGVGYQRD